MKKNKCNVKKIKALFVFIFLFITSAFSQDLIIRADENAPKSQQPIILNTANNLPQINIQTPNNKGLSHNKYSQFDVDSRGAILNNSRINTNTLQAGLITANPYLSTGSAKIILNEINSSQPSQLKGYLEVAGEKADVIIANSSGIHCTGCGFIHSDRVTLTTGKSEIHQGNLESFTVNNGKIKISNQGLDNSLVDYTEILAREIENNAGIWSKKELKIISGKNKIQREENEKKLSITQINKEIDQQEKPQFSIDVGQLGGMYSGKIHLIGTESGVGIKNDGHIGANFSTVKIDGSGKIINTGLINANQSIELKTKENIENTGKIENLNNEILLNAQNIEQNGILISRSGNIFKNAEQKIKQNGESIASGSIYYQTNQLKTDQNALVASGVSIFNKNE